MKSENSFYPFYPFGWFQPRRDLNAESYQFGFNGQEMDNEVSGTGNTNTAMFWEYDTRLGRRWNVDPAFALKPWMSPYHAFSNKPILNVDPNGAFDDGFTIDKDGKVERVDNTIGSDYDVIYDKEKYDAGQRDFDETGKKSGIKINQRFVEYFDVKKDVPVYEYDAVVDKKDQYTIVINNPVLADRLFKFISRKAQNTSTNTTDASTWNGIELFHQFYKKGSKTINIIHTDHIPTSVFGALQFAHKYFKQGWTLIQSDHNHPSNNPTPSGEGGTYGDGDIHNKGEIQKIFPDAKFHIYIPRLDKSISY